MLGRAAYQDPALLAEVDRRFYGAAGRDTDLFEAVRRMRPLIEAHVAAGGRLSAITRHMLGLFQGRPGARAFRRILTEGSIRPGAGLAVLDEALAAVRERVPAAA